MGKQIKVTDQGVASDPANAEEREARWAAYIARYQAANPVKFAEKKANHEFDTIPVSFK